MAERRNLTMEKAAVVNVMRRYEVKYILTKEQLAYLQPRLLERMKIDRYGMTSIASLYYDTADFFLIRRSIEKPFYKEKLRLRSYGLAKEGSPVYLEIKRKNDGIVYKRRAASTEEAVESFLNGGAPLGQAQIERELETLKNQVSNLQKSVNALDAYKTLLDKGRLISEVQDHGDGTFTIEMPASEHSSEISTVLNEEHTLIMTREYTIEEGIEEMNERVAEILG